VANNKEFEDALNAFIDGTFSSDAFIKKLEESVEVVRLAGYSNSLAQTLLKYTAPGVPDLYQGSELWDLSLVDPDNRRPVDYTLRAQLLKELEPLSVAEGAAAAMASMNEGLPKLWLIHRALGLRRNHPEWFGADAAYTPLAAEGAAAGHVVAYLRGESVVTVVPRLVQLLDGAWKQTAVHLPAGQWINQLTGETFEGGATSIEHLLKSFPVALLTREMESHA
jgi:(1->4)-alpha-D-glucan 1-alpha-D-glucosylmutase